MNFARRRFLGSSLFLMGSALTEALATPLWKWRSRELVQAATSGGVTAKDSAGVQFVDVAQQAGLNAPNVWGGEDTKRSILEAKGSGLAFFDYDMDGWLDIYLTNGDRFDADWPKGKAPTSHLYKNNRDGTFTDVTEKSGLARTGWQTGVCVGDYDNDGWDDLFCCFWGHNILFHNNGDGTFTDVTRKSGLYQQHRWGAGATFLDYDRDGHLDLFVCNYIQLDPSRVPTAADAFSCQWKGVPTMCGPRGLSGGSNILFHNNDNGSFTDVSEKSGILKPGPRYSISAVSYDFDNDGWPDIYVAVDSEPSILFKNNHDGTFTDVAVIAGCAYDDNGNEQAGMGIAVADYDCDGWFDIYKTNFSDDTCNLYHNNGNGTFSDVTFASGVGVNNSYVAWGCGFADYDNDGWIDIIQINGHVYPGIDKFNLGQTFKNPRLVYRNLGNGHFKDVSAEMGPGISERFSSRGAAFGDYDNDGGIDVLVLNLNDLPSLLHNTCADRQNWIKIKLQGTKCNRTAIGARVRVTNGKRTQMDEVHSGTSVMSQSDLRLHFGLGGAETVDVIEVKWPTTEKVERFLRVKANQILTIREGEGIVATWTPGTKRRTVSSLRGLGMALLGLFLVCSHCASQTAKHGQAQAGCKGPPALETAIASHPTAAAYDALGVYFGSRKQSGCAIRAFEKAVQMDPQFGEAHYDLGLALLDAGKVKESVVELQRAAEKMPSVAQVHTALAMSLDGLSQRDAAIAEYRKALQIDPKSIPALDGISKALIAERRYKEAVEVLNSAPMDEGLQCDLASANSAAGETDRALQTMMEVVKMYPASVRAHLQLGLVYRQQDRNRNAVEQFQRALELDASSDEARAALLQAKIVLGDYASAEALASEYLRRSPTQFNAVVLMGEVERGLGKYPQALILFRRAVRMNPLDYKSRYGLGFVLFKQGQPREASFELQKALEIKADSGEAHFQLAAAMRALGRTAEADTELGLVQKQKHDTQEEDSAGMKANEANRELKQGDAQKAADLYREALAEDPHNAHTFYNLALALEQLGDSAAERSAIESALALDPKLAPAHNLLGLLHLEAGENQQAERQLTTAVSLDPDFAEAYRNLAVLDGQLGKPKEAEEAIRRAIQIDPRYEQAHVDLALLMTNQGRLDEAEAEISTAIGMDGNDAQARTARGMILTRLNRGEDALVDFRKALELSPNSPHAHLNLGIALADKPDLPGALAEFSQAVRLAPTDAAAHYNLGRVFYDQRNYEQARPELTAAIAVDPQIGDAHYLLGMIEEQAGNEDAAESHFKKAVALMPQNGVAVYMLGQSLQHKGKSTEAVECWRKAIALKPDYADAYYSLARATARSNPAESQTLLAKFQQLQDRLHNNDRAEALGSLALAAAAQKDWPQAITQLQEGIRVCADCNVLPILHKDLGIIYCQSGDWNRGLVELEQAQKLAPDDPEIAQSIRAAQSANK